MALDMRPVKGETKAQAIAKARIEYGSNFQILSEKEIPIKSLNPFAKKKTEYEIRILLINSIYEGKKSNITKTQNTLVDNNAISIKPQSLETERLIPQKQVSPIDSTEMAERLVAITKLAKDSLRERAHNENNNSDILANNRAVTTIAKHESREVYDNVVPIEDTVENKVKMLEALRERNNDIDKKVEELVESKVKSFIDEYLSKRTELDISKDKTVKEVSNTQLSEYENYIKHDNKIVAEARKINVNDYGIENFKSINFDNINKIENTESNSSVIKKETNVVAASKTNNYKNDEDDCAIEDYLEYLRERDFPKDIIANIKEYLNTASDARFYQSADVCRSEGLKYIEERLRLNDGIDVINSKKKIIVLLGPTGVGKTTTLPKIAANYIKSGKKVSFVTIDNYRIGAVDQLQSYASIMRVPFKSVNSPDGLRLEVRNMDMNSVLFVDTTGRSPKASEDIVALSKYFATVGRFDIDIQLVMSATVKYNDASNIINSFKPTNYRGIILTKTDETDYLAGAICAVMKSNCPITYATFGQKVPKDIATGLKYKNKIIEGLYGLSL